MNRLRLRPSRSRSKRRVGKTDEPPLLKTVAYVGELYRVERDAAGSRVVKRIHGALVGDKAYIHPANGRHGGPPARSDIVSAKMVFRTARGAAGSMKLRDGYMIKNHGHDKPMPCKVAKNGMGDLVAFDNDGNRVMYKAFPSKKAASKAIALRIQRQIASERSDLNGEVKRYSAKLRELEAILKKVRSF